MIKVEVCMPDKISINSLNSGTTQLSRKQGEIIEVVDQFETFKWGGNFYPIEWFKVVEETPYQKWEVGKRTTACRKCHTVIPMEDAFNAGRESLKEILGRCKDFITSDALEPSPEFREDIKKELER